MMLFLGPFVRGGSTVLAALFLGSCKPSAQTAQPAPPPPGPSAPATVAAVAEPPPANPHPARVPVAVANAAVAVRPLPSPVTARSSERGILYVVKAFSFTTESGIYAFPAGTRVKLVREERDALVVSDGLCTATAPKASFSATRIVASPRPAMVRPAGNAAAVARIPPPVVPPAPVVSSLLAAKQARQQARLRVEKAAALEKKRAWLTEEIASLKTRIAAAEAEIPDKQGRQRPRRYFYDAYGNLLATQNKSAYTLSADASNLEGLRKKIEARKVELADLPSAPEEP